MSANLYECLLLHQIWKAAKKLHTMLNAQPITIYTVPGTTYTHHEFSRIVEVYDELCERVYKLSTTFDGYECGTLNQCYMRGVKGLLVDCINEVSSHGFYPTSDFDRELAEITIRCSIWAILENVDEILKEMDIK
jgi:hypothetical protein